ncbi:acetate kinase [Erythrobacter sp. SG61-1L]|uniref:acetate/propionate family kinase n=1 Tax=Erythrobacter sp. SG61-1L TaxID=1603897 RepID=UPI0006C8EAAC|nr:acetate/propionate family kinase [Erythrobacter sp. SG61-1L]KPL68453.1 acetate kinase [Erythrobacter sp. SG61-1L]
MTRALLSLNAGSSSIKFALFVVDGGGEPLHVAGGKIEGIGTAPHLAAKDDNGEHVVERRWPDGEGLTHEDLLGELIGWLGNHLDGRELLAVGHRVVHGGTEFVGPVRVDDGVLARLDALCPLAPLHQPHNLAAIRAMTDLLPQVPQIACFDTAFHHAMPPLATRLALPRALHDEGIRRYGFHGLSYDYVSRRLRQIDPALADGRVIAAHLGNGASMCAMAGGASVDTTMGFTALDGLVMGTRSGSLDPGAVLHLIERKGMSAAETEAMLYQQSGLLGVSGISSDMRVLRQSGRPEAEEAIALFAWRAVREAGGLMSSLGGLDGLVFTAGIGENDADMRARICAGLAWAGVALDQAANEANAPIISSAASAVKVFVIPTDEERMIAMQALSTLGIGTEGTA